MIDQPATAEHAHEVLDLIRADRIADSNVHTTSFLKRTTTVDADDFAGKVKEWSTRVPWIDGCVRLNAVGILEQRACRILVTIHAADDSQRDGGLQVAGEHKRITSSEDPLADADRVAIGNGAVGKSSRPSSLISETSPVASTPTMTAS